MEFNNKETDIDNEENKTASKFILIELYEKYQMRILWSVLGLLVIALIFALILVEPEKKSELTKDENESISNEVESENKTEPEKYYEFIADNSNSLLYNTIDDYLQSTIVNYDNEKLSKLVDADCSNLENYYIKRSGFIDSIKDLNIYDIDYVLNDINLIYVSYNIKFKTTEALMPVFEPVLVKKSDEKYVVHILGQDESMADYTAEIRDYSSYKEMVSIFNDQASNALSSDDTLNNIYNSFISVE